MRLNESIQEDIISSFQIVLDKYKEFKDACSEFRLACDQEKDLKYESDYLYDFVREELWEKVNSTEEEILDVYYPIDYADDEENSDAAGERYRNSKEARESVFNEK